MRALGLRVDTNHLTNSFRENIHDLRLAVLVRVSLVDPKAWFGRAYLRFYSVKHGIGAFIENNKG